MTDQAVTAAHDQITSHRYTVHYPWHYPRETDPNYPDFNAYHRKNRPTARCFVGQRVGFDSCKDAQGQPAPVPPDGGEQPGLELHHAHIEFSLQNGVSFEALEVDYPGISDPTQVGAWIETDPNFRWLCVQHHRGSAAGAHSVAHADWEGGCYVPGLLG